MSLRDKIWSPVSIHAVVLAWLQAERNTHIARVLSNAGPDVLSEINDLLDQADIESAEQNRSRLRLLYIIRNMFVLELPPDTSWYRVSNLTDDELNELHAVNYYEWNDTRDKNELAKVAARKNFRLEGEPKEWRTPILWGHDKAGPFTIIEGNHRLTAYVNSNRRDLDIPVFVGLSPMRCLWHIFDNCPPLIQDLIVQQTARA